MRDARVVTFSHKTGRAEGRRWALASGSGSGSSRGEASGACRRSDHHPGDELINNDFVFFFGHHYRYCDSLKRLFDVEYAVQLPALLSL